MADHEVRAQLVPSGTAGDIDALATEVDAVAGTDTVTIDRGQDKVVSIDLVVTDAVLATAESIVDDVVAAVDVQVFSQISESDPVLDSPADVAIDISDADSVKVVWTATLSAGARIASIDVTSTDLAAVDIPVVIKGDPQGHESQKNSQNQVIVTVGPAPTGGEVGSPHALTLAVTDTNGRTSAVDSVNVAVTA